MELHIIENGLSRESDLLFRHVSARIHCEKSENGLAVTLGIDDAIETPESYRIDGSGTAFSITGSDRLGLIFGVGKFLHSARWTENSFFPKETCGVVSPDAPFRSIYFSVHAFNWYHLSPIEEMEKYLEELLLYGYNALHVIIPVLNFYSFEDEVYKDALKRTRAIFQAAKRVGMKLVFGVNPNQGLLSAPHEFDADLSYERNPARPFRGTAGRNLCPNKPGAVTYLRSIWLRCLSEYKDIGIDYVISWPYDEGGCGCEKCAPWGANGFEKLSKMLASDAKAMYPDVKFIYCTWTFDVPDDQKEYSTLYKKLTAGEMEYVDYLMTDAHRDYPEYVLTHPVVKPIVNFPEISMWGLFPWGGFGANPLPKRFERIWNSSKAVLSGGDPYSEGLFEDISKVQFAGYYWNKDADYREILGEYAAYEFGEEARKDAVTIMEDIEKNHVIAAEAAEFFRLNPGRESEYTGPLALDFAASSEARRLAEALDRKLSEKRKTSWRWRILYIRAVLDEKRYRRFIERKIPFKGDDLRMLRHDDVEKQLLADDPEAQALYKELRQIFCTLDHDNGMNMWTLPVVQNP